RGNIRNTTRCSVDWAFTLIEMIGVLAVIAVVAVVLFPVVIKRIDRASGTKDAADLSAIADSYTQYILRTKSIPGYTGSTNWASAAANQMSLPLIAISQTPRGYARAFLIDTNLSIGGAGLPYTQNSNGTTAKPVEARVMIVSCPTRALPISSGVPSKTEFYALWDTADGAKPTTSIWTSWAGNGEDVHIKKLNLDPLFYQLIRINHDSSTLAKFDIDNSAVVSMTNSGTGWNSYYLDGTVLSLRNASSVVQTR